MKKQRYSFSKKIFPSSARRVANADGNRVWLINGLEFKSKRAYFEALQAKAQAVQEALAATAEMLEKKP